MNKILLSIGAAIVAVSSVFAQTNAITSGNMPVNDGAGYTFEFEGTATDNCTADKIPNAGIAYAGITVDSVANGKLYVTTDTSLIEFAYANLALRLYDGNCDDYSFDMSTVESQKISLKIKSSVELKDFKILVGDGGGSANDSLQGGWNIMPGQDTVVSYDAVNFNQWESTDLVDNSDIVNVYLYFRNDFATQVAGNFEISYIKLGDAPVGLDAGVKGEAVSVYPNPATTKVSFAQELENVVIYNMIGVSVYETASASSVDVSSFDAGVYYVQHANGTARFTVQ